MKIPLPTPDAALAIVLKHWLVAVLALALVIQTVRIEGFRIWPLKIDGLKIKLQDAKEALNIVANAKKVQLETTTRTVTVYRDRVKAGDKQAEKVEQAPTEANCRTPDAIMGADL